MCLITTQKKPRTAKKDLVVYKVVQEDPEYGFRSLYYSYFHYIPNMPHSTEIEQSMEWNCHCDIDADWLNHNYPGWRGGKDRRLKCFGSGFHSSKSIENINMEEEGIVIKAIIPKGSLYYENKVGFIISNQIILTPGK